MYFHELYGLNLDLPISFFPPLLASILSWSYSHEFPIAIIFILFRRISSRDAEFIFCLWLLEGGPTLEFLLLKQLMNGSLGVGLSACKRTVGYVWFFPDPARKSGIYTGGCCLWLLNMLSSICAIPDSWRSHTLADFFSLDSIGLKQNASQLRYASFLWSNRKSPVFESWV